MSVSFSSHDARISYEMFARERVAYMPGAIDTTDVGRLRSRLPVTNSDLWLPEAPRWTRCQQSGEVPQLSFNRLADPNHPVIRPFSAYYRQLMREYRFLMEQDRSGVFDPRALSTHGVLKAIVNHYPPGGGMAEHVDINSLHGGLVAVFATQDHLLRVQGREKPYDFEMEAGDVVVTPVDIYTGQAIALGDAFLPPHEVPVNSSNEDDFTLVLTTRAGTDFRDRPILSMPSL